MKSPEQAIEVLLARRLLRHARSTSRAASGWTTRFAERLGELRARAGHRALRARAARSASWATSRRAGGSSTSAVGALDRSAGIVAASGAELVVFHPGFLLGRSREAAIDAVVEQLGTLRERLEAKERAVPFGIEVMGRVRDLGSVDDVVEIAARVSAGCGRFSTSRTCTRRATARISRQTPFARGARSSSTACSSQTRRSTSTSPTSPSRTATRRSTCPYGEGTLRAEPLRDALAGFDRPATVISESPDEESSQAIRSVLEGAAGTSSGDASLATRDASSLAISLAVERGRVAPRIELSSMIA